MSRVLFLVYCVLAIGLAGCGDNNRQPSSADGGYIVSANQISSLGLNQPHQSVKYLNSQPALTETLKKATEEARREGWDVDQKQPFAYEGTLTVTGGRPRDSEAMYLLQIVANKKARKPSLTVTVTQTSIRRIDTP